VTRTSDVPSESGATVTDIDTAAFLRSIGKRIRLARLSQELTQDQLAAATSISRSFISLVEKGTHGIDVVRLYRLAAVLGVPLAELLAFPPQAGTGAVPDGRDLASEWEGGRR
jgi:transcriptional regulator with XRE-family HTH domain